jgi:hypothetical protein
MMQMRTKDLTDCVDVCANIRDCVAVSWVGEMCYLKDGTSTVIYNSFVDSKFFFLVSCLLRDRGLICCDRRLLAQGLDGALVAPISLLVRLDTCSEFKTWGGPSAVRRE